MILNEPREEKIWDYIIIGTGMGGGPIGLRLAQAGFSVLFLEKGRSPEDPDSIHGEFAESAMQTSDDENIFERAGRFKDSLYDSTNGRLPKRIHPFLGSGVGGSSALYGMVLERFQPIDMQGWPIPYEALTAYYAAAEDLFKVRKNSNYKHPGNQKLEQYLKNSGFKPYSLPLANEDRPGCGDCQSMICPRSCKNDSGKVCISPALQQHRAQLLTECEVLKIESSGSEVTGVCVQHQGQRRSLRARNTILSAGGLASPILLMKSATEDFPQGLGNRSGALGRYLMRHLVDLYALQIDSEPGNPHSKEIGLNDFYQFQGEKLGTVQSFGRLPPTEVILTQWQMRLSNPLLKGLLQVVRPLLQWILERKTKGRLVLASIVEDSPQFENRVWLENEKMFLSYKIPPRDQSKLTNFRRRLRKLFRPLGLWLITTSEKNEMLAHVCGTCRMGADPLSSVVDLENRVHGLDNLYVVDGSFFPTSGGTNPALTIAANSLRVADILIQKEKLKVPATDKHFEPPE